MNSYEQEAFSELCDLNMEVIRLREQVRVLREALHILHPRDGEWITPNYEQDARISAALEATHD